MGKASPFDGFISYHHGLDSDVAAAVQSGLEKLARPWYRRRALRIFRDLTNLTASPDAWHAILDRLAASRWFVLLACPESAESAWVRREIQWWLQNRGTTRVILLITGGHLAWDTPAGDFDWAATTAVPKLMARAFSGEPLYVDVRWVRNEKSVDLELPRFRSAMLDVAAPLHGKEKDEMHGEAVRTHKRNLAWMWGAISALSLALAGATIGWRQAYLQSQVALSRQLAAQARNHATRADLRMLLSVGALEVADTIEARHALSESVHESPVPFNFLWGAPPGDLYQVEFPSRDYEAVAITTLGTVVKWNVITGQPAVLESWPQLREAANFEYGANGDRLAIGTPDGRTTVWNVRTKTPIGAPFIAHEGAVTDVAFASDGLHIASASGTNSEYYVWSTENLRAPVGRYSCRDDAVWDVEFSPNSKFLAAACDSTVVVRNIASGEQVASLPFESVEGGPPPKPRFSPNGKDIAIAHGKDIAIWDFHAQSPVRRLGGHGDDVRVLAYRPDGKFLASAESGDTVYVWDLSSEGPPLALAGHAALVSGLAWSFDGAQLISVGAGGSAIRWDFSGRLAAARQITQAASNSSEGVSITPWAAAFLGSNNRLLVWDALARKIRDHGTPDGDSSLLAVSSDGTLLALLTEDDDLDVIDLAHDKMIRQEDPASSSTSALAISPDGKQLAIARGRDITLEELLSGRVIWEVKETRKAQVTVLRFSPDSHRLASGAEDGSVRVRNTSPAPGDAELFEDSGVIRSLAFSPDETKLAVGTSDSYISLWNLQTHSRDGAPLRGHTRPVFAVEFSPKGDVLASGGGDQAIILWDVASRMPIAGPLRIHSQIILGIVFEGGSSDELISIGRGGELVSWDVGLAQLVSEACRTANRTMQAGEWMQFAHTDRVPGLPCVK